MTRVQDEWEVVKAAARCAGFRVEDLVSSVQMRAPGGERRVFLKDVGIIFKRTGVQAARVWLQEQGVME
jgi:hypothetical protein